MDVARYSSARWWWMAAGRQLGDLDGDQGGSRWHLGTSRRQDGRGSMTDLRACGWCAMGGRVGRGLRWLLLALGWLFQYFLALKLSNNGESDPRKKKKKLLKREGATKISRTLITQAHHLGCHP